MDICVAAIDVAARFHRHSGRLCGRACYHMMCVEITYRPAVGNKISAELPLAVKLFHQLFVGAGRLSVYAVVSAHNARHAAFHQLFKGVEVRFGKVFLIDFGVELMPQCLRTAVHGEMFRAGGGAQMFAIALYAFHKIHAQLGG